MSEASISGSNRRAHLRYRDPEATVIDIFTKEEGKGENHFKGLIINESFKGMAVVFVGDGKLKKGDTIYWKETETINTSCQVIRCTRLEEDVYSLALRVID